MQQESGCYNCKSNSAVVNCRSQVCAVGIVCYLTRISQTATNISKPKKKKKIEDKKYEKDLKSKKKIFDRYRVSTFVLGLPADSCTDSIKHTVSLKEIKGRVNFMGAWGETYFPPCGFSMDPPQKKKVGMSLSKVSGLKWSHVLIEQVFPSLPPLLILLYSSSSSLSSTHTPESPATGKHSVQFFPTCGWLTYFQGKQWALWCIWIKSPKQQQQQQ